MADIAPAQVVREARRGHGFALVGMVGRHGAGSGVLVVVVVVWGVDGGAEGEEGTLDVHGGCGGVGSSAAVALGAGR